MPVHSYMIPHLAQRSIFSRARTASAALANATPRCASFRPPVDILVIVPHDDSSVCLLLADDGGGNARQGRRSIRAKILEPLLVVNSNKGDSF